jgi:RNA polymerase sigma-70 factor (ECF subfamily)
MHQSTGRRRREFERLAKRHQRDLLNAARRLTRTLSDAEDLAQEALIKAYISFDQFELGTNFRAWLLKIVTTTHISRCRKHSRQPQTITWDDGEGGRPREWHKSNDSAPEALVVEQELDEPVQQALAEMPDEFRAAVIMRDIFDLSYKEVAKVLQVPLGTVRSRICRGRRILAEQLREYAQQRGYL